MLGVGETNRLLLRREHETHRTSRVPTSVGEIRALLVYPAASLGISDQPSKGLREKYGESERERERGVGDGGRGNEARSKVRVAREQKANGADEKHFSDSSDSMSSNSNYKREKGNGDLHSK